MKLLSDKKNILFGLIFTYVALAVSLIGSFFITPFVLNNIGDDNYGLYSFCNSITSWLSLLSTSLGASYIYFANKSIKERGSEYLTNSIFSKLLMILSGIVALISILSISILKISGFKFSNYSDEQNDIIFVLLFTSGIHVAVAIFFSIFSLYNNFRKSFAFVRGAQIVFSIIGYTANIVIALTAKSIVLISIFSLISAIIQGLFNFFYAIKLKKMTFEKAKLKEHRNELKIIARYSSILLISYIISNLDSNLDKTLLGIMVDAESVTMYQLSITFASHLSVLSFSFIEVMRPTLYEKYRDEQFEEANRLFIKICKIQLIVVLFIIGGFLSCGYHFVTLWIQSKRIMVFFYSYVLFVSNIVPLTIATMGEGLRATNNHKMLTVFSVISITINLILSISLLLLLNNEYAVWACIIGTVIPRFVFGYIVTPIYAYKRIKIPIGKYYLCALKNILFMIIALIPGLGLTFFLHNIEIHIFYKILFEGLSFVIIYAIEFLLFDRQSLKELFSSLFKRK